MANGANVDFDFLIFSFFFAPCCTTHGLLVRAIEGTILKTPPLNRPPPKPAPASTATFTSPSTCVFHDERRFSVARVWLSALGAALFWTSSSGLVCGWTPPSSLAGGRLLAAYALYWFVSMFVFWSSNCCVNSGLLLVCVYFVLVLSGGGGGRRGRGASGPGEP